MKTYVDHICLNVANYDWYVEFFKNVFEMRPYKEIGEKGSRKLWFDQGIQLNEAAEDAPSAGSKYDHIGLSVDTADMEEILRRAKEYGCTSLPKGEKWISLRDGLVIELMIRL